MLVVSPTLSSPEEELREEFLRSPGPGGQHVNKSSTAVRLRFNAAKSFALPAQVIARLLRLAGSRATPDGEILIEVHDQRSQKQNREIARERLADLIRLAARPPKPRTKTKPSKVSKEKRIHGKKARSQVKQMRRGPGRYDD